MLIRGAYSSNIKERRDCSAALFDARGRMVAQAEHIPVHLGAMPAAVRAVMDATAAPGDVFILNDPFSGGTHLPDITLVSPMALDGEIVGYAVTRAHHSDVGGMTPGSMPADSRAIYQEGLVIPPVRLVERGRLDEDVLTLLLANVRTPDDPPRRPARPARGQRAGRAGGWRSWSERRGRDVLETAFDERARLHRARAPARRCAALPDGTYTAEGEIEGDGSPTPTSRCASSRRRSPATS